MSTQTQGGDSMVILETFKVQRRCLKNVLKTVQHSTLLATFVTVDVTATEM